MEEEKTIYTLKLHEHVGVGLNCSYMVTRVPGGWIYQDNTAAVFVPFSDEFMEVTK